MVPEPQGRGQAKATVLATQVHWEASVPVDRCSSALKVRP